MAVAIVVARELRPKRIIKFLEPSLWSQALLGDPFSSCYLCFQLFCLKT